MLCLTTCVLTIFGLTLLGRVLGERFLVRSKSAKITTEQSDVKTFHNLFANFSWDSTVIAQCCFQFCSKSVYLPCVMPRESKVELVFPKTQAFKIRTNLRNKNGTAVLDLWKFNI